MIAGLLAANGFDSGGNSRDFPVLNYKRCFMKTSLLKISVVAVALAFAAGNLVAQDAAGTQLSYGVSQVVQLSKANVSEDTIVSYVQNSGNSFNLDANQIIYLKDQGVSANVINAMISQKNRPVAATTTASAAPSPAVVTSQPQVTTYVPSSTVYVIPDTQTYYYNTYYARPYYYPWPAVSLSFGWGGGWGGYHGGWHGGGWHH